MHAHPSPRATALGGAMSYGPVGLSVGAFADDLVRRAATSCFGAQGQAARMAAGQYARAERVGHMATVMLEKRGAEGCCTERDLRDAGFTDGEIAGMAHEARERAKDMGVTRLEDASGDSLERFTERCITAMVTVMPVSPGVMVTDAMTDTWGAYCRARTAQIVDPWTGQQTRCLDLLQKFIGLQAALPSADRVAIGGAVVEAMNRQGRATTRADAAVAERQRSGGSAA